MKKVAIFLLIITLMTLGLAAAIKQSATYADVYSQAAYQTPTPNQDGQILYTVQEGDNCIRIYLLTGVTVDEIIRVNNLGTDCSIFPSQQLLLVQVDPTTPMPDGPLPTATAGLPTPTPFEGTGKICVALFEDLDGNQKRSANEVYLSGGVISVSNRVGTYSETQDTVGGNPDLIELPCFEDLEVGEYNLSMGIPDGYNPTTSINYAIDVTAGDTIIVDFGAQPSSQPIEEENAPGSGRSPFLLTIGLFLLAGGAVLAFFFIRSRIVS